MPASRISAISASTRTDAARDEKFWTELCNARVSDWIGDAPLLRIDTAHHSIALFPAQRTGVQHINHQVEDIDDVMRSYYFLKDKGVKILLGPGAPSAVDRGDALFPRAGRHGL